MVECSACEGREVITVGFECDGYSPPTEVMERCPVCKGEGRLTQEEMDRVWGDDLPTEEDALDLLERARR